MEFPGGESGQFEIYGEGYVGDKAAKLQEYEPAIAEVGWQIPHTTVISQDILEGFLAHNGIADGFHVPTIDGERLAQAEATPELAEALDKLAANNDSPMAVRSSAGLDARGTGIYETFFAKPEAGALLTALKGTLASYFTDDAAAFRRDTEAPEGMGIFVQPIIGMEHTPGYAPLLSGTAYAKSGFGNSIINVVPGFGGGVSHSGIERIVDSALTRDMSLSEHVEVEIIHTAAFRAPRRTYSNLVPKQHGDGSLRQHIRAVLLLTEPDGLLSPEEISIDRFYDERKLVEEGPHLLVPAELENAMRAFQLRTFFENLDKLRAAANSDLYLEWAADLDPGQNLRIWITQMAPMNARVDSIEFTPGTEIMTARNVVGNGIKHCRYIVDCWNFDDIPKVRRFNRNHSDYELRFTARTTASVHDDKPGWRYGDISNAAVLIESEGDFHNRRSSYEHFRGLVDVTDKLFGVENSSDDNHTNWETLHAIEKDVDGLKVFEGNFVIIADEKKDRMVVRLLDDEPEPTVDG